MRRPARTLVVDTSIMLAISLSRAKSVLRAIPLSHSLITSARAVEEGQRRLILGMRRPELQSQLDQVLAELDVVAFVDEDEMAAARRCLQYAVASLNGSTNDAHILALAWAREADIWSTDRDFAGTGVASWSTANLMRAFAAHA